MAEENIRQEFRLQNIDETRNYFIEEIKQNQLLSKKHLNYVEHLFILASAFTGCVSISDFASLAGIPVDIASSKVGIKFVQ